MEKIIARGAEALLIKKNNSLIKRRISKGYRHNRLDEQLRSRRTRSEGKIIAKLQNTLSVPQIIDINEKDKEIFMEFIIGERLSENLDKLENKIQLKVCEKIGENIAIIHNNEIIHGDLTTSNMILHERKVYFIDFGLAFHSSKKEDKAVDLHLLRQALESKHFEKWEEYFKIILHAYEKKSNNPAEIIKQLEKVEARGRYKGKH